MGTYKPKEKETPEERLAKFFEDRKPIVGTYVHGSNGVSFIIPDDERLPQSLVVRSVTNRGQIVMSAAVSGQKIVAVFGDKVDQIDVIEVLGPKEKVGIGVLGIIRAHSLIEEFPNEVVAEARRVAKLDPNDYARRTDLRGKVVVTIDPETAQDLDDAVSLEKNPDGTYTLGVHIADVSHYVKEGSELDDEAFKRGTSVYFPGGVLPMLPTQLSNNICSLNPNEDRLAMSVFMIIERDGTVREKSVKIVESVINVATRFSYETVQKILDGDTELCEEHKKVVPMLNDMAELTHVLEDVRKKRGEVVFDVPEPKIILDEKTGVIKDVVAYPCWLSHRMIESFMVLCNEVIAEFALEHRLPFVYRIHEKPEAVKVSRLVGMLKPFGVVHKISADHPTSHAYQKMIASLGDDLRSIISELALQSIQKAKYSPDCLGHFGLASENYCHFTSPIRRYPDLVIHRILKMMLNRQLSSHKLSQLSEFVLRAAEQSTKTEITAMKVERAINDLKRAEYMKDRIGEEFDAVISGIMEFGVFVRIPANTVKGLIKMDNLPRKSSDGKSEYWRHNQEHGTLTGKKGNVLKPGERLRVRCIGVNMDRCEVDFSAITR